MLIDLSLAQTANDGLLARISGPSKDSNWPIRAT